MRGFMELIRAAEITTNCHNLTNGNVADIASGNSDEIAIYIGQNTPYPFFVTFG